MLSVLRPTWQVPSETVVRYPIIQNIIWHQSCGAILAPKMPKCENQKTQGIFLRADGGILFRECERGEDELQESANRKQETKVQL